MRTIFHFSLSFFFCFRLKNEEKIGTPHESTTSCAYTVRQLGNVRLSFRSDIFPF